MFVYRIANSYVYIIILHFFGGLECAAHSFAYVVHFLFLRTQRAAGASRRATTLISHESHLPNYKIILYVHCISTQL